ncbi:hypothetical protein [Roseitranquillus sediminis]|uniref:hypothetical protein n=1 Tax=Roseitranquillus sediminis TaxID=2809051 RepID=UPI001D0C106F|nr:hypothetical protein [Roseitranquillus sediminis]MBM9594194.1 hypothetical protein [Roseitranquillus sediminis]
MLNKAIVAAATFAIAAPAVAQTQLERTLGVAPGAYTTAELVELKAAIADEDRKRIDFILSGHGTDTQVSTQGGISLSDRVVIANALDDNEFYRADYAATAGRTDVSGDASVRAQFAAGLGVSADDYTLAELVDLRNRPRTDPRLRPRQILPGATSPLRHRA